MEMNKNRRRLDVNRFDNDIDWAIFLTCIFNGANAEMFIPWNAISIFARVFHTKIDERKNF